MKTCILTIACVLVVCLLLGALCYVEFGTVNFVRLGLALSNLTGSDGVYQISEGIWLSGSADAFRDYLTAEGYRLVTDDQMGSRIPVEKDGLRDYVFWSVNGMYHKWTWETRSEPAPARPDAPAVLYYPESATGAAYFYPQAETQVTARMDSRPRFSYPAYGDGWHITARPAGTLVGENGLEYDSLYWEREFSEGLPMEKGFCVSGGETAPFLEDALQKLGLSRREAGDFLRHWLPQMEGNAWNLICFHTNTSALHVSPTLGTHIRVFMVWKPLEEAVEIAPQDLTAPERTGFTVVEWGGSEIK